MASMQKFLADCAQLEAALGQLYRRFSTTLNAHPETARFFQELAAEEDRHANAVRLVARLVRNFTGKAELVPGVEALVPPMQDDVAKATAVLDRGGTLTEKTALALALRIESTILEGHSAEAVVTDSRELQGTLAMLATDTREHRERIRRQLAQAHALSGPGL